MICQKTYYCLAAYWFCLPARLPVVLRTLWLSVGLLIHQPPRTIPPIAKNEAYYNYTQDDNCSALKYSECCVAAEPFKIIPIITHFWQRRAVIRYIIEHSWLRWVVFMNFVQAPLLNSSRILLPPNKKRNKIWQHPCLMWQWSLILLRCPYF